MQYTTTPGTRGICPSGWHIPTYSEFQTLSTARGGDGNALKAIGQGTGGGAGTNTSGFSELLAGARYLNGNFYDLGRDTYFWSSTKSNATNVYYVYLTYSDSSINYMDFAYKAGGFSVRCVKD